MTRALTWTSLLTWTLWTVPCAAEPAEPAVVAAFAGAYFQENMEASGLLGG